MQSVEPEENGEYQILDVSDFKSPKGDKGIRVKLASLDINDKKDYSTILWVREEIGTKSKLGAFLVALAELDENGQPTKTNTDGWNGTKIHFIRWTDKKREIEVIED